MSHENSDEYVEEYRNEQLAQRQEQVNQPMSPENRRIVDEAKAAQVKPREGWIQKGENFFTFANYDNLPMEYKQFIPRQNRWKSDKPITDPLDGRQYIYGMTIFDNGGTSVWSKLATQGDGKAGFTAGKKYFYKTIDVIEGSVQEIRAQLKAVDEDKGKKSIKYVNAFPVKEMTTAPDGSKTIKDTIVHVMLLQERIDY